MNPLALLAIIAAAFGAAIAFASSAPSTFIPGEPTLPEPPTYPPELPPEPAPEAPPRPRSGAYGNFLADYAATPFASAIRESEARYGLPENLLARVLWQESHFDPKAAGSKGELGIAQFMPTTAADWEIDPLDPAQAIPAAAAYLYQLASETGSWHDGLVAYNWGIGRVRQRGALSAPPQVTAYASNILMDSEA